VPTPSIDIHSIGQRSYKPNMSTSILGQHNGASAIYKNKRKRAEKKKEKCKNALPGLGYL